jgi:hypothetical protein
MARKHLTEQGARNAQVEEQGDTNELLSRLLELHRQLLQEQQRTNQLLEWLGQLLQQPATE